MVQTERFQNVVYTSTRAVVLVLG